MGKFPEVEMFAKMPHDFCLRTVSTRHVRTSLLYLKAADYPAQRGPICYNCQNPTPSGRFHDIEFCEQNKMELRPRDQTNTGDCCSTIQCTGNTGTFTSSQTITGTIGGNPAPQPGGTATGNPGSMITGALSVILVYYDRRCPTFGTLPTGCSLRSNPNDPCCQQPVCPVGTVTSNGQPVVIVPTYGNAFTGRTGAAFTGRTGAAFTGRTGAAFTGYGQPVMPQAGTQTSGMNTTPSPGSGGTGTVITGSGRGCVYKSNKWRLATWDDGCQYRCECLDPTAGQYRCTERCPAYVNLPPQCSLQTDPHDHCCKTVHCDYNMVVTTPAPIFAVTTPPTGDALCHYKGLYYRQGESWYDGCGLQCRCEDALNHYYQCTDRCPKYTNVPSTCTFVADPKDPQCCRVPQCQNAGGNEQRDLLAPSPDMATQPASHLG
ncbi:LOW QUALITY PROTEIN: hypothetical protein MAR_003577 [Mya arenaria]|uniref:VWFC domain-containing protein n=1 Tax=Mya arenaria TaxID=6604 RepID=A0ABY7G9I4_MYAAR|nr:LOW QUALITY PROTEIN: hypothetical protein MAR_003577 [Mya arenaria]